MAPIPEEEAIIIAALVRFSHDYEQADEELAATAWELAQERANEHGVSVEIAPTQLNIRE